MAKSIPEYRYRYIELIAYWEGRINTTNLVQQFGHSRQQSSADIKAYNALAPGNITYDSSLKGYLATESFAPRFISGDVAEYFEWLQNPACDLKVRSANAAVPNHALSLPARKVAPEIMRGLISAIRQQRRIEVDYVSLSNPNREGRVIAPHTFINTGLRWHLRAWCEKSQEFRDFVLSRFRGTPELLDKSPYTAAEDAAWTTSVTVILQPDPRLSPIKREVLENDYQMAGGQLHITVRACLVNYLLREMQINIKMLDGTPEAQQLVLVNSDDVKRWLFEG